MHVNREGTGKRKPLDDHRQVFLVAEEERRHSM
jgi:hypothetical protein